MIDAKPAITTVSGAEKAHIFRSNLGWIGVCWQLSAVSRATFGHDTRRGAAAALPGRRSRSNDALQPVERQLVERLIAFSDGAPEDFTDVPVSLNGITEFRREVLSACRHVPYGESCSYGDLAARIGRPKAARAVGTAMAQNPIPLIIPCHRIVGAQNRLGGYSAPGGLEMKQRLLELECS